VSPSRLAEILGTEGPVVAMVHFPGLPGRPRHDASGGMDRIVDAVGRDVVALQEVGADALLFCNEGDIPYQLRTGPEIPAAMAAVIGQLRADVIVPFGVNVLWDPIASLALARATGARFVREVFTGVYETDLGLIEPRIGDSAAYREAIGAADVALFDNVAPEFGSPLGRRSVADRARSAEFLGMDAVLVSGSSAGAAVDRSDLLQAKEAVSDIPVIANTGVQAETVAETLAVADGVIVGTALKRDGVTWNPVDPARAKRFLDAARSGRAAPVSQPGRQV